MIKKSLESESQAVRNLLTGAGHEGAVTGAARAARFAQQPATVWLRGPKAQVVAKNLNKNYLLMDFCHICLIYQI